MSDYVMADQKRQIAELKGENDALKKISVSCHGLIVVENNNLKGDNYKLKEENSWLKDDRESLILTLEREERLIQIINKMDEWLDKEYKQLKMRQQTTQSEDLLCTIGGCLLFLNQVDNKLKELCGE